jgi:hypothetical protein
MAFDSHVPLPPPHLNEWVATMVGILHTFMRPSDIICLSYCHGNRQRRIGLRYSSALRALGMELFFVNARTKQHAHYLQLRDGRPVQGHLGKAEFCRAFNVTMMVDDHRMIHREFLEPEYVDKGMTCILYRDADNFDLLQAILGCRPLAIRCMQQCEDANQGIVVKVDLHWRTTSTGTHLWEVMDLREVPAGKTHHVWFA